MARSLGIFKQNTGKQEAGSMILSSMTAKDDSRMLCNGQSQSRPISCLHNIIVGCRIRNN